MSTEVKTNGTTETATISPEGVKVEAKKIKTIVITSTGSGSEYSNIKLLDEDYPKFEQDSDMVVVRIKAAGLNFAELMQRQGTYRPQNKTPYTPGFEGAGIIEAVGDKCKSKFKVGHHAIVFNGSGIWKDVVCLPSSNVIEIPKKISFEDAASILVNYLTAYQMLHRMAHIKEGDSILIHMAAGGVGTAATQLCRLIPNVTIFGTASAAKHEYIKANGVDHPIDYTTSDYTEEIKKICPKGVDIVFDPLNGHEAIKGYELVKPFGKIVYFGAASMTSENKSLVNIFKSWWKGLTVSSLDIMADNKSVCGYHLGYLLGQPETHALCVEDIAKIMHLFEKGKLTVHRDSVFTFSKVGEAMRRMHARKNMGKIVLVPDCELEAAAPEITNIVNTMCGTTKKQEKELREKEAKEQKEREAREKEAKEKEHWEKEMREKAEKEEKEKLEKEAKEKAEAETKAKEEAKEEKKAEEAK